MWKLIFYEYSKVLQKNTLCFIFIGCLILNGILVNHQINKESEAGYSLVEVSKAYKQYAESELTTLSLEHEMNQLSEKSMEEETADDLKTYRLLQTMYDQVVQLGTYEEYLKDIDIQSEKRLKSPLFATPGTFSYRNLEKTPKAYKNLDGINIKADLDEGVLLITNNRVTDTFLLVTLILLIMQVFIAEREDGTLPLVKPMKLGHGKLLGSKILMMAFTTVVFVLFFYGTNYLLVSRTIRFGDTGRAIQSLSGYFTSAFSLTVAQYMSIFPIAKIAGVFAVCCVFMVICMFAKNSVLAGLLGIIIYAVEHMLWINIPIHSWLSPLQQMNAAAILDTGTYFSEYRNINFVSYPINSLSCGIISTLLFTIVALLTTFLLYNKETAIDARKSRIKLFSFKRKEGRSKKIRTSLWYHELYKTIVTNKAGFVLLVFLIVQIFYFNGITYFVVSEEFYYRTYSEVLSGPLSEEKEDYLAEEKNRIESLQDEEEALYQRLEQNEITDRQLEYYMKKLEIDTLQVNAFERAYKQYSELLEVEMKHGNVEYIYQTSWDRLFGVETRKTEIANLGKSFFVIIILLSSSGALEKMTYMDQLIAVSVTGKKGVMVRKIAIYVGITIVVVALTFLPDLIRVYQTYGVSGMHVPAGSYRGLKYLPKEITLLSYFMIRQMIRFLLVFLITISTFFISMKTGNRIITICIGAAVFLIPVLVLLLI